MNKILTLEDLVAFCESGKLSRFSSSESGYSLRVKVPATYAKHESDDYTLYGEVKIMHTGRNRNGSNLTLDAMNKCKKNLAYKPLLANFCEVDGVKDFTSHDFTIGDNGEVEYQEFPIGCFTADEPRVEYDKEKDRNYLYAICAIPREYTAAAEIIERKGGTKVSAELAINEMSYDAKEKELVLEDVEVVGVTCLGTDPETGDPVEEGMEGARLDIADFSNSFTNYDIKLLKEMLDKYKSVENFALQKGEDMGNEQLELELEETPIEETVVEEILEETPQNETEALSEEVLAEEPAEEVTEDNFEEISEVESTIESEEAAEPEAEPPVEEINTAEMSVSFGEKVYTFKQSLRDELYALSQLVNDTYAESDNAYYEVDVYSDSKEVVMVDFWSGKAYKQTYKVRSGKYSLVGDRVSVHARYITDDEEKALDDLKANYAAASEKLQKYEDEPKKMEILNSPDYGYVSSTDEFEKLKIQENHFDLSIEDTKAKADEILLNAAKKAEFANTSTNGTVGVVRIPPKKVKEVGRYGGMFVK